MSRKGYQIAWKWIRALSGGQELKQRLVSSGLFYTSDAAMMIEEMVSRGKLKMVSYDTYVRGSTKREDDSPERKNPPLVT